MSTPSKNHELFVFNILEGKNLSTLGMAIPGVLMIIKKPTTAAAGGANGEISACSFSCDGTCEGRHDESETSVSQDGGGYRNSSRNQEGIKSHLCQILIPNDVLRTAAL
jgi:hypothetical protein